MHTQARSLPQKAGASALATRSLIFLHRWLGVVLSMMLTVWFVSGIVMMYWSYPSIGFMDRLQHATALNPSEIRLTAEEAFARAGRPHPAFVLVSSFDGRPVYLGAEAMIYADDGSEQGPVDDSLVDRSAAAWTGRPIAEANKEAVVDVDQWTLDQALRRLRPLYKYSWPDGQQVYVHGATGDVVQYTTRESRFWAYVGAIPHWLYLPAFRTYNGEWMSLMVWSSLAGIVVVVAGLVVAAWMYSPRKRYRFAGVPTSLPYRNWKRWHTIIGLVFGVTSATWLFSGLLSLEPFRMAERLTALRVSADMQRNETRSLEAWTRIAAVLRGARLDLSAYAGKSPAEAIASIPDFEVKELQYSSLFDEPVYLATSGSGDTRIVPVHGEPIEGLDWRDVARRMQEAGGADVAEIRLMDAYDTYYHDREGRLPLPVLVVRMNPAGSLFYVDPRTASVIDSYTARDWVNRWLFHGLHSLDLPWLYQRRPLWDITVITLMLGGTALCATSLVLTWRVLVRKVASAMERVHLSREELDRPLID